MTDVELDARTWDGLEYLESVSGPGAIAELVEGFVHDAPRRLIRMKAASEAGEWEPLQRLAHDLKSNCATVGALQLSLLAAEIEARQGRVTLIRADISTGAGARDAVAQAFRAFGSLDGLINNAGGMVRRVPYAEASEADYDEIMDLNARSVVVIDADGKVAYTELVPETTQEPDYDAAVAALG